MIPTNSTTTVSYDGKSVATTSTGVAGANWTLVVPRPTGSISTGGGNWKDPYSGLMGRDPLREGLSEMAKELAKNFGGQRQPHDWYNRFNKKPSNKKLYK